MGNNEMMLGVDGTLNIVPDHPATSPTCGHRAGLGIGQEYLPVLGLHDQGAQTVQALYFPTQRRDLLGEPVDLASGTASRRICGVTRRRPDKPNKLTAGDLAALVAIGHNRPIMLIFLATILTKKPRHFDPTHCHGT